MTDPAALERGYRRLLAWYPQPFRREQEEEVLAVLMSGARQGQRRPQLRESADLIRSALGMRLRPARSASENRPSGSAAMMARNRCGPMTLIVA
jgi:hypothetical protein